MRTKIKVFVRVRPSECEENKDNEAFVNVDEDKCEVNLISGGNSFMRAKFDKVFSMSNTQDNIFKDIQTYIHGFINGINTTIFAYGQTGSGKTYTMFGAERNSKFYSSNKKNEGIIQRSMRMLYDNINISDNERVFCSFIQLYNDQPYDLIKDPQRKKSLKIVEENNDILLIGLSEYEVNNLNECMSVLEHGDNNRASRSTTMNDVSSRSHSIFTVTIERSKDNKLIKTKLHLVDLAGSEKWHLMDELGKDHVKELKKINSSLHVLGKCIQYLSKGKRVIPFRESKLTRILKESLEGNSKTVLIATLSPDIKNMNETISTIKFADRAKNVLLNPIKHKKPRKISEELVRSLEKQILQLKQKIKTLTYNSKELNSTSERMNSSLSSKVEASSCVEEEFRTNSKNLLDCNAQTVNIHDSLVSYESLDMDGSIEVERSTPEVVETCEEEIIKRHVSPEQEQKIVERMDVSLNNDDSSIDYYQNITRILKDQLFSHSRELAKIKQENYQLTKKLNNQSSAIVDSDLKRALGNIETLSREFFQFRIEEEEYERKLNRIFESFKETKFKIRLPKPLSPLQNRNFFQKFKLKPLERSKSAKMTRERINRENVDSNHLGFQRLQRSESKLLPSSVH